MINLLKSILLSIKYIRSLNRCFISQSYITVSELITLMIKLLLSILLSMKYVNSLRIINVYLMLLPRHRGYDCPPNNQNGHAL